MLGRYWYQDARAGDFVDYTCMEDSTFIRTKYRDKKLQVLLRDGITWAPPDSITEFHEISTGDRFTGMDAIKMQDYRPLD